MQEDRNTPWAQPTPKHETERASIERTKMNDWTVIIAVEILKR